MLLLQWQALNKLAEADPFQPFSALLTFWMVRRPKDPYGFLGEYIKAHRENTDSTIS